MRSLGPGIRARRGSRLWLDNCVFRDITLTPAVNRLEIQASGIAAESNVELIIVVSPRPCSPSVPFSEKRQPPRRSPSERICQALSSLSGVTPQIVSVHCVAFHTVV